MHPLKTQMLDSTQLDLSIELTATEIQIRVAGNNENRQGFATGLKMGTALWVNLITALFDAVNGNWRVTNGQPIVNLSPVQLPVNYFAVEDALRQAIGKVIDNRSNSHSSASYEGPMPTELVKWVSDEIDNRIAGYKAAKSEAAKLEAQEEAIADILSAAVENSQSSLDEMAQAFRIANAIDSGESIIGRPILAVRNGQPLTSPALIGRSGRDLIEALRLAFPTGQTFSVTSEVENDLQQGNQADRAGGTNELRPANEKELAAAMLHPFGASLVEEENLAKVQATLEANARVDQIFEQVWKEWYGDAKPEDTEWASGQLQDLVGKLQDEDFQTEAIDVLASELDDAVVQHNRLCDNFVELDERVEATENTIEENYEATKIALTSLGKGLMDTIATVEGKVNAQTEAMRTAFNIVAKVINDADERYRELGEAFAHLNGRVEDIESRLSPVESSAKAVEAEPLTLVEAIDRLFLEI